MTRVPMRDVPRRRRFDEHTVAPPKVIVGPAPPSKSLDLTGSLIRAAIASEVEALGGSATDARRIAELAAYALWSGSAAAAFGP